MGAPSPQLKRQMKLFDAVWLGLGSILGTGIFVSVGIAAGVAGPSVIVAVALAAVVATFNALSSAQLAAARPVSGGTYEYGYHYLGPAWGFLAGWMFLLAKSASAATAALGFSGYVLTVLGITGVSHVLVAFIVVLVLTGIVAGGVRRTSRVNAVVVSVTIVSLAAFVLGGLFFLAGAAEHHGFAPFFRGEGSAAAFNLFEATALMFVAYTGYGRIATLAEEVENPRRTIPRAVYATLLLSALLYVGVSIVGVGTVGADFLYKATEGVAAPLSVASETFGYAYLSGLVAIGAATAMLGVLLNLVLGLSRVLLAMGRRGDMPSALARVDERHGSPWISVMAVGTFIALLALIGSVKATWSFSALTVLSYYGITNAAALALPADDRLYPRWVAFAGLFCCLSLTVFLDKGVLIAGVLVAVAGLAWFRIAHSINKSSS